MCAAHVHVHADKAAHAMCKRRCRTLRHVIASSMHKGYFLQPAGYHSLLICRMVVGLGEASFVSLASPLIGTLYSWHAPAIAYLPGCLSHGHGQTYCKSSVLSIMACDT